MNNINTHRAPAKSMNNLFGDSASFYHEHAAVQRQTADRLIASLDPWKETLPPGPVLELGCGTGFVSRGLKRLFTDRPLIITDRSRAMVEACRRNVGESENTEFRVQQAESVPEGDPTYALTISSFAAQWFRHPAHTLGQWLQATRPGGLLLAAFPGHESFPEWRRHAEALGLPFTRNALPDTEEMVVKLSSEITQVDYYEDTITQQFPSALDFFRHMKRLGAGRQHQGRHLSAREMRLLTDHWDAETSGKDVTVSYHVVFLAVKRTLS